MIIICPSCEKKFEVDANLIPEKGRLVKCGFCDETWFFNKNEEINIISENLKSQNENKMDKIIVKSSETKEKIIKNYLNKPNDNKGSELIKYQSKSNLSFLKILNYLLVSIISFVALILILDTFKNPLGVYFPNLELVLYNLFETLKDLTLFVKDLN